MTDKSENLQPDDVVKFQISPENQNAIDDIFETLGLTNTFEAGDFVSNLCRTENYFIEDAAELVIKGVPCRVITSKQLGWRSGTVKLNLQFIPDEPEPEMKSLPPAVSEIPSPLNEIRKQLED